MLEIFLSYFRYLSQNWTFTSTEARSKASKPQSTHLPTKHWYCGFSFVSRSKVHWDPIWGQPLFSSGIGRTGLTVSFQNSLDGVLLEVKNMTKWFLKVPSSQWFIRRRILSWNGRWYSEPNVSFLQMRRVRSIEVKSCGAACYSGKNKGFRVRSSEFQAKC